MESITVIIKTSKGMKEYTYEGNLNIPVTTLLERINVKHDIKIHYSSSCLQGLCGSCSMIINGLPKLACKTFVNEEATTKKMHKITIEPLSKFHVVKDLVVDRTSMFENIKNSRQWLEEESRINQDNLEFEYEASQCYGAILPVTSSKISKQESNMDKLKFLKENYSNHFYNDCVKSLACENICPMNIQTQRAISIMNRHSIWKFHKLLKK